MHSVTPVKQITTAEGDLRLQFARQLYDMCLERHGEDHEETRLVLKYISGLERRALSRRAEANHPSNPLNRDNCNP